MEKAITIKGTIFYKVKEKHPGYNQVKYPDLRQVYEDTYVFGPTFWTNDVEELENYVKQDLLAIVSGNDTSNIFDIEVYALEEI